MAFNNARDLYFFELKGGEQQISGRDQRGFKCFFGAALAPIYLPLKARKGRINISLLYVCHILNPLYLHIVANVVILILMVCLVVHVSNSCFNRTMH